MYMSMKASVVKELKNVTSHLNTYAKILNGIFLTSCYVSLRNVTDTQTANFFFFDET